MSGDPLTTAEVNVLRAAVIDLWDPIGVADSPEAADEYDSYLPGMRRELSEGSVDSLSEYLNRISSDQMGLSRNASDDREAAEALHAWWRPHHGA